jgi:hypothetical protein
MGEWEIWLGRFSLACLDLILWESLYDTRMPTEFRDSDDKDLALIEQLYSELPPFEGNHSYTHFGVRWFSGTDLLLCYTGFDLRVRTRTREALCSIRENLPGDWLYE